MHTVGTILYQELVTWGEKLRCSAFSRTGLFSNTFQSIFSRENRSSALFMNLKRTPIKRSKILVLLSGLCDLKDILNLGQKSSKKENGR